MQLMMTYDKGNEVIPIHTRLSRTHPQSERQSAGQKRMKNKNNKQGPYESQQQQSANCTAHAHAQTHTQATAAHTDTPTEANCSGVRALLFACEMKKQLEKVLKNIFKF